MSEKTLRLGDILTTEEMQECIELYPDVNAIEEKVIKPNIERINRKLKQENDTKYLAYLVINVINQSAEQNLN